MRTKTHITNNKNECDETCQSLPRSLPKKIQQQTVKHNYQGLTTIPSLPQYHFIRNLYLSHNKIVDLKGIENYIALQSLNLSYNCIQRVQELRRIANPMLLKHLKLRMNPLAYGYEDYAVSIFQNLQTFEDIKISRSNKQQYAIMRDYVSKNIIQFARRVQILINTLSLNDSNKQNNSGQVNVVSEEEKTLNLIDLNINFLDNLKEIYVYPEQGILSNMSVGNLLKLVHQILQIVCQPKIFQEVLHQQHYLQRTQRLFSSIVDQVLLKFSARHDKTLINHLHKINNRKLQLDNVRSFAKLGIFSQENRPIKQARISGGAVKSAFLDSNPAKYVKKDNKKILQQHPINKMANWQQPTQYKSLIPFEQTKWYKFYAKYQNENKEEIFEQLPIFIYCKQYLQVIAELVLQKTSEILNIQNFIKRKNNVTKIRDYPVQLLKKVDQQIQLDLSNSDGISFGQRQKQIIIQTNELINYQAQRTQQDKKTLPKQANLHIDDFSYNISRYSLYEINLSFKVFRTLKDRIKKRKNPSVDK